MGTCEVTIHSVRSYDKYEIDNLIGMDKRLNQTLYKRGI